MNCNLPDGYTLQHFPGGFYCWQLQPNICPVFVSDSYFAQLGCAVQPLHVLVKTAIWPLLDSREQLALKNLVLSLAPGESTTIFYPCSRPDGTVNYVWDEIMCRPSADGGRYLYGNSRTVTRQYLDWQALHKQAQRDSMTGLLNRGALAQHINDWLQANPSESSALVLLDLDGLKFLNDTFGHPTGDQALRCISQLLQENFSQNTLLSRIGGDEFALFFPHCCNADALLQALKALLRQISTVAVGPNHACYVRCSAGFTMSAGGLTLKTLYKRADDALYHVKRNGKNDVALYVQAMDRSGHSIAQPEI